MQIIANAKVLRRKITRLHRLFTEGITQQRDVRFLMVPDLDEASASRGRQAGVGKGFVIELEQRLGVGGAFEVLESERVIENGVVWNAKIDTTAAHTVNGGWTRNAAGQSVHNHGRKGKGGIDGLQKL